ncbi:HEPN domain protein [Bacteroidales bacterium Barb6XT]|nr:HEPN domain protein [Bacteroidales bacterium Barb6XT]
MTLSVEERNAILFHRVQKAKDTLHEAKGNIELGFWTTAANRLYYACYYMAGALLIKNGYFAHTHSGVIRLLGQHFISEGIISKELGKFYSQLFELRQTGDYDDWRIIEESDVQVLIKPAEDFIKTVEEIILS